MFKGLLTDIENHHFGVQSIITKEDLKSIFMNTPSTLFYLPPNLPTEQQNNPNNNTNITISNNNNIINNTNTNNNTTIINNNNIPNTSNISPNEISYACSDFLFYGNETEGHSPVRSREFIEKYLPNIYQHYTDPYLTTNTYLSPPPINSLHCVYGINSRSEVAIYFTNKYHKYTKFTSKPTPIDKGTDKIYNSPELLSHYENIEIRKGIAYEVSQTEQKIISNTFGITVKCSGDGTVPYKSLFYPIFWKNAIQEVKFSELEKTSHTDAIQSQDFFSLLVGTICEYREHVTYNFLFSFTYFIC